MHNRSNYAVSEVVSYILIIVIIATTTSSIFFWYVPSVERIEAETQVNSMSEQLRYFSNALDNLLSQGVNASSMIPISFNEGNFYIESIKNVGDSKIIGSRIVIYYSLDPDYEFNVSGLDDSDNEFEISFDGTDYPTGSVSAEAYDLIGTDDGMNTCSEDSDSEFEFSIGSINISGAYKIDLFDEDNSNLFGRIWVFDTGSVVYELNTGQGTYHVSAENLGVIKGFPTSSSIDKRPKVFYENNNLILYVLQLNTTNDVSIGGSAGADVEIHAAITNRTILENRNVSYNFKMQFFNDDFENDIDAWNVFYRIYHDFIKQDSDNIKFDSPSHLEFTLVRTVCDLRMEV